jgi:hypothetical protein
MLAEKTPIGVSQPEDVLEAVRQIWEAKRGRADFPRRSEFSLRDLRRVIHHLAFVAIEGELYRIKFMGDSLVQALGNRIDQFVTDAFVPPRAKKLCQHFAETECARVPITICGAMSEGGDGHRMHHTLIAPLAEDGVSIDGFMIVILFGSVQR